MLNKYSDFIVDINKEGFVVLMELNIDRDIEVGILLTTRVSYMFIQFYINLLQLQLQNLSQALDNLRKYLQTDDSKSLVYTLPNC